MFYRMSLFSEFARVHVIISHFNFVEVKVISALTPLSAITFWKYTDLSVEISSFQMASQGRCVRLNLKCLDLFYFFIGASNFS